jgi:hypothetical protein
LPAGSTTLIAIFQLCFFASAAVIAFCACSGPIGVPYGISNGITSGTGAGSAAGAGA